MEWVVIRKSRSKDSLELSGEGGRSKGELLEDKTCFLSLYPSYLIDNGM